LAGRQLGAQPAIQVGLDPDAIKQRRIRFHCLRLCGHDDGTFKT
jgi:hypothetical protein